MINAPIVDFSAYFDASLGHITGYAAPAVGQIAPCLVEFTNGGHLLGAVRATEYSSEAAGGNIRHGWCGFSLAVQADMFLFEDVVKLRCGATQRVFFDIVVPKLKEVDIISCDERRPKRYASFERLIEVEERLPDKVGLARLLYEICIEMGPARYVDILYRMFLLRGAEASVVKQYQNSILFLEQITKDIDRIIASEEYKKLSITGRRYSPFQEGVPHELLFVFLDRMQPAWPI